ncbi:hypothetical protein FRAAL4401 [Frankia alni ACN14a]|uniref:Uncharacterized protein n=1 Tax=Frankia alni (strain DSM 45986 / CECT 9034 / ACN14a) TaxID=326424 RepID=Q0RHI3_FRAAA|nr:hypothetical protein FRAAL4401 [Frankia alni ACN14a]
MRSIGRVRRSTPARCIVRRPGYGRLRDQTQRRVIPAMALAPTSHTRPFSRARTAARAVVSFTVHRRSVLRDRAAARNEPLHTPLCRFGRSRNDGEPVRVRTVVRLVPVGPAGRRRPPAAAVAQRAGLLRAAPVTRENATAWAASADDACVRRLRRSNNRRAVTGGEGAWWPGTRRGSPSGPSACADRRRARPQARRAGRNRR